MKKQISIIGALLTIFSFSQAQDIAQSQVPSVILNQFNSQFSKSTAVEWEMESSFYKVDFELGWNIEHEVWYDAAGEVAKHKEDISANELPEAVKNRIKTDFNGYSMDDLKRITDNGEVVYKMELNSLLQQDWDVVIDTNGNVVSKIAD